MTGLSPSIKDFLASKIFLAGAAILASITESRDVSGDCPFRRVFLCASRRLYCWAALRYSLSICERTELTNFLRWSPESLTRLISEGETITIGRVPMWSDTLLYVLSSFLSFFSPEAFTWIANFVISSSAVVPSGVAVSGCIR